MFQSTSTCLCKQGFSRNVLHGKKCFARLCMRMNSVSPYSKLLPISYFTSIQATVMFTSLIKHVSQNSMLDVVSSVILCHYDGVSGLSSEDTGYVGRKRLGTSAVLCKLLTIVYTYRLILKV